MRPSGCSSWALDTPEVKEFIEFALANADRLVKDAKYIPLPAKAYDLVKKRFSNACLRFFGGNPTRAKSASRGAGLHQV